MASLDERLSRLETNDVLTRGELRRHRIAIAALTGLVAVAVGIFVPVAAKTLSSLESD